MTALSTLAAFSTPATMSAATPLSLWATLPRENDDIFRHADTLSARDGVDKKTTKAEALVAHRPL